MKLGHKLNRLFLTILIASLLLSSHVLAADTIDTDKDVSLEIYFHNGDYIFYGTNFYIYLVATIDENGTIDEVQDVFQEYRDEILQNADKNMADLAFMLQSYVKNPDNNISCLESDVTNSNGRLTFNLEQGLYLVIGDVHDYVYDGITYTCTPLPFMIYLPTWYEYNDNQFRWEYNVIAYPKDDFVPVNTPSGEGGEPTGYDDDIAVYDDEYGIVDTPGIATLSGDVEAGSVDNPEPLPTLSGSLPQTGQLWWPIPILVAVGLVLIIIGIIRRRNFEYEE